jgi:hypothetical protein
MVAHLAFLLLTLLPSTVFGSSFATLYEFNNGITDATKFCDATQWALVETTIHTAAKRRRRRLAEPTNNNRRFLGGACTGCGPYCVKSGAGCIIQGRRLLENEVMGAPEPPMDTTTSTSTTTVHRELGACDQEMSRVTAALDALLTQTTPSPLADSCRASIALSSRKFTCVQTTQDCFVQSFDLWDARNNVVLTTNFTSGGSFCGYRNRRSLPVSFEAKSNFYIGKMQFVVRGPNNFLTNRTEYSAPYFLNGNYANGAPGPVGFYPGDYVLTATSEDDAKQAKSISFRVTSC